MPLYSAEVMDVAKRVPKPGSIRMPKEKKPRTEKQIAAAAKAAETRKANKALKEAAAATPAPPPKKITKRKAEEMEAQIDQALETVLDEEEEEEEEEVVEEEVVEEPVPQKKLKKTPVKKEIAKKSVKVEDTPPPWVQGVIKEFRSLQQELAGEKKKSDRKLNQEAKTEAAERWADPKVRNGISRVGDEVIKKMVSKIFG